MKTYVRALTLATLCTTLAWTARTPGADARPASATAAATDLTGRWEADFQGDSRVFLVRFNFKQHGDTLGGTLSISSIDGSFDITNGRVTGDRLSFESFGSWTGTIRADSIDLTREIDNGRQQKMTAHRVKP
jgi:hypothetical protein